MKNIYILLFIAFFFPKSFCQDLDRGTVVYVDSLGNIPYYNTLSVSSSDSDTGTALLSSRKGKFKVYYDDNFFMTEGVKLCMKISLDAWEEKLDFAIPVKFYMTASEDLDPDVEIKTTVGYFTHNRTTTVPISLNAQIKEEEGVIGDTININAFVDWETSWGDDGVPWGIDKLQTSLQRHIAHILGFGTSVVPRAGGLGFAIRRTASVFDNIVSDGQTTLGSLAVRETSASLNNFLSKDLYLSFADKNYKLYTSPSGFVPYRSGCYFSLQDDNLMNYPYGDKSVLHPINKETLDVLEAIGWNVKPHDVTIQGTNVDALGYGSIYQTHVFHAKDNQGKTVENAIWTYQTYDSENNTYIEKSTGTGNEFLINPTIEDSKYLDEFMCLQGLVTCTVSNLQYTFPLSLNVMPSFIDYEIMNVQEIPNSDYYSFDIKISSRGMKKGKLLVSSDYGTLGSIKLDGTEEQIVHVSSALKIGKTNLTVNMENDYGTVLRHITFDVSSILNKNFISFNTMGFSDVFSDDPMYEVYTMQGIKIGEIHRISDLSDGVYIIKNIKDKGICKKIIIK